MSAKRRRKKARQAIRLQRADGVRPRVEALLQNAQESRKGRRRAIVLRIAQEHMIPLQAVTVDLILSCRCCVTEFPKVKYATLGAARSYRRRQGVYPCECTFWHRTTHRATPPMPFVCEGCKLTYAVWQEGQRFCTRGCRRRHNLARHKAGQQERTAI